MIFHICILCCPALEGVFWHGPRFTPSLWFSRLPAQLSIDDRPGCEALTPPARWVSRLSLLDLCDVSATIWRSAQLWGRKETWFEKMFSWYQFILSSFQTSHEEACHGRERLWQLGSFAFCLTNIFLAFGSKSLMFWWCWTESKFLQIRAPRIYRTSSLNTIEQERSTQTWGPEGKGRKLAWQGASDENTKGTAQLRSFLTSTCTSGSESHASKVHIQTYVLRHCLLERTRMRTCECTVARKGGRISA